MAKFFLGPFHVGDIENRSWEGEAGIKAFHLQLLLQLIYLAGNDTLALQVLPYAYSYTAYHLLNTHKARLKLRITYMFKARGDIVVIIYL